MDTAKTIKELRESTGMSRKEFSELTGIPVRTLEDWEAGRRTPPEYIPRLLVYQIRFENIIAVKEKSTENVSIITDPDGKMYLYDIVTVNYPLPKGRGLPSNGSPD
ncbi:MAG: helix-turn-helix domain-containing protein [Eubacterium sp.]|nr:helix-turn-helix domain-containing protein [Eubacterium sp.]